MKRRSIVSTGVLLSLAALSAAAPGRAVAEQRHAPAMAMAETRPSGAVLAGQGEVRTSESSAWMSIHEGSPLPRRCELRATSEPLRVRLAGDATLELAPGAAAGIAGQTDLTIPGVGKIAASRVDLRSGEIAVTSPDPATPADRAAVLVQGPPGLLALSLRGMLRARALDRRGELPGFTAASYDGDTQYATNGAFHTLANGYLVELRAGVTLVTPRRLRAAPAWNQEEGAATSGPLAVVTAADAKVPLTARFASVDGASEYELDVATDETFANILAHRSAPASATSISTPPLARGSYFARVRARGPEGLPGLTSTPRRFRVALAALPPGATMEAGSLLLPHDRALTWDDPTGLEVAIGRVGFTRAAAQLGLLRDAPTAARVRLAGDRTYVPLALAPIGVTAEIVIGPKWAVWPNIPVEVQVRLVGVHEPAPGSTSAPFEPKLHVAVNLAEVPVHWKREGNLFRTSLGPNGTPGPWVVRVEATDAHDNPLGRAFLEVTAKR